MESVSRNGVRNGVAEAPRAPCCRGVAKGFGVNATWCRGVALSKPPPGPVCKGVFSSPSKGV